MRASQELLEGDLPIPSVVWEARRARAHGARLRGRAAPGARRSSRATASRTAERRRVRGSLFLAVRPIQVISAWQFLNLAPGFAPIHELGFEDGALRVNVEKQVLSC